MSTRPKLSPEAIVLIREMAQNNRLWGAERLRGEVLKLAIRVSTDHPVVYETRSHLETARPDLGDVPAQSRKRGVDLQLLPSDRSVLSLALGVLHQRTQTASSDPRWCDAVSYLFS